MKKRALITGINGMDGSHLADLLLEKDYEVYGLERRSSVKNRTNSPAGCPITLSLKRFSTSVFIIVLI